MSIENRLPTEQEWHSFEEKANEIYLEFMAKLISRTKRSEIEKKVCWLVRMKVAPSDIASLVSRTPKGITSIRARLFKKLFKISGNGRDFDNYIGQMSRIWYHLLPCILEWFETGITIRFLSNEEKSCTESLYIPISSSASLSNFCASDKRWSRSFSAMLTAQSIRALVSLWLL